MSAGEIDTDFHGPRYRVHAYVCKNGKVTFSTDEGFTSVIRIHQNRPMWCRFIVMVDVTGRILVADMYHVSAMKHHDLHTFPRASVRLFGDLDTALMACIMGYDTPC